MKISIYKILAVIFLLIPTMLFAQNNSSSQSANPYAYDNLDLIKSGKPYNPGVYNYYMPQDTFDSKNQLFTNPDELRKLGVDENSISTLLKLKASEDSLKRIKQYNNKAAEEKMKLEFAKLGIKYNSQSDTTLEEYIDLIALQKWEILEKALRLPESYVYGQEFFRRNKLRMINSRSFTKVPENYTLSTGDEISINVYGDSEYNENLVVDESGSIKTSVVGWIFVKGMTVSKARSVIKSRLSSAYNLSNSSVDINISSSATVSVNVVGEVFNPGTYKMSSSNSAYNVLVEMEGPNQMGSLRKIYVKRNGKTQKTLDIYKYLLDPTSNMDYQVENDDYIVVPTIGNIVHISGPVKRPFNYEMLDNETITDLLKYAGGFKPSAFKTTVTVKRYTDTEIKYLTINIDDVKNGFTNFKLLNGDSVFVSRISNIEKNYIYVSGNGAVMNGNIEYKKGDRISDALRKSGGLADRAYRSTAFVIRFNDNLSKKIINIDLAKILDTPYSEENILLEDRDTLHILSANQFRSYTKVGIYGAVNKPGEFDLSENVTIKDLIILSGGLRPEAAGNVIEVYRIVTSDKERTAETGNREKVFESRVTNETQYNDFVANYKLKAFDQVYVRNKPYFALAKNIKVTGEILYPGEYPLNNNAETLQDMLEKAGGVTKFAYIRGISIYRKTDLDKKVQISLKIKEYKDLESDKHNIVLAEGDSIVVPSMNQTITIKGAFNHNVYGKVEEIKVPYDGRKTAKYYIEAYAGGYSSEAKKSLTAVIQPGGKAEYPTTFLGMNIDYPIVENGATIEVARKWKYENPEMYLMNKARKRQDVKWGEIVAPLATALTSIITVLIVSK